MHCGSAPSRAWPAYRRENITSPPCGIFHGSFFLGACLGKLLFRVQFVGMIDSSSSFISSCQYFLQSPSGAGDGLCPLRLLLFTTDWPVTLTPSSSTERWPSAGEASSLGPLVGSGPPESKFGGFCKWRIANMEAVGLCLAVPERIFLPFTPPCLPSGPCSELCHKP